MFLLGYRHADFLLQKYCSAWAYIRDVGFRGGGTAADMWNGEKNSNVMGL